MNKEETTPEYFNSLVEKLYNEDLDESEEEKIIEKLSKNFSRIYLNYKFYKIPLQKIILILKNTDPSFFSQSEVVKNIFQNISNYHKNELLISSFPFDKCDFTIEEWIKILESLNNEQFSEAVSRSIQRDQKYTQFFIQRDMKVIIDESTLFEEVNRELFDFSHPTIHDAAKNGYINLLKYMIERQHIDPNLKDEKESKTPLHYAVMYKKIDIVKYLLDNAKANPKATDKNGFIPLHIACEMNNLEIVTYLIEKSPRSVDIPNFEGMTPLHIASQFSNVNIVKYLIIKNANKEIKDKAGKTPYDVAGSFGGQKDEIRNILLSYSQKNRSRFSKPWYIESDIFSATANGNLAGVQYLIEHENVDPMQKDDIGNTPLHIACKYRHIDIVKYLIQEKNVEVDCPNIIGNTPALVACESGALSILKFLLDESNYSRANASFLNKYGDSLLHIACQVNDINMVNYLINEKKLSREAKNNIGYTPLLTACYNGNIDLFQHLIDNFGVNAYACDNLGNNSLHIAAERGHILIIKYLLEVHEMDINSQNYNGETPLFIASRCGKSKIVNLLLNKSCRVDLLDIFNRSANDVAQNDAIRDLIDTFIYSDGNENQKGAKIKIGKSKSEDLFAFIQKGDLHSVKDIYQNRHLDKKTKSEAIFESIKNNQLEILEYITQPNTSVSNEVLDDNGESPIMSACKNSHLDMVKYFIEKKNIDPETRDHDNNTLLHIASSIGSKPIVQYIIEDQKVNIKARNNHGCQPFHSACQSIFSMDVVKYYIVNCRLDPNLTDANLRTPLSYACEYGIWEIAQYLLQKGASPNFADKQNMTPLHYACQNGHVNIVKSLIEKYHANTEIRNKDGYTPLQVAYQNFQESVISYFYSKKSSHRNLILTIILVFIFAFAFYVYNN